ncbi:WD40-repeat-containing domain protein [Pavlovales sp. CCMP2436]|nr:WD40-repeat-containing domain protein [Pavlovales sp. CCMP2436]
MPTTRAKPAERKRGRPASNAPKPSGEPAEAAEAAMPAKRRMGVAVARRASPRHTQPALVASAQQAPAAPVQLAPAAPVLSSEGVQAHSDASTPGERQAPEDLLLMAEAPENPLPAAGGRKAAAARKDPAKEPPAEVELSEYERERQANLARNRAYLQSLGLLESARALRDEMPARTAPSKARGLQPARKQREAQTASDPRRSPPPKGMTPEGDFAGGVPPEGADGSVVVMVAGEAVRYSAAAALRLGTDAAAEESVAKRSRLSVNISFRSLNASESIDAAYLQLLRAPSDGPLKASVKSSERAVPFESAPMLGKISNLSLREARVAKLTKRDIVHLAFQPRSDCLLLAAADKAGHVALWDVRRADETSAEKEEGEKDDAPDGVLLLQPHEQYVSGLKWSLDRPSRLFTASYDGTVRVLDLSRAPASSSIGVASSSASWSLVLHSDENDISALEVDAAGNVAWWADNKGAMGMVDVRQKTSPSPPLYLHDRKINFLSLDPGDGIRLASCSTDATVCGTLQYDVAIATAVSIKY